MYRKGVPFFVSVPTTGGSWIVVKCTSEEDDIGKFEAKVRPPFTELGPIQIYSIRSNIL